MYVYNVVLALHIDTTALSDGTYELIPEFEEGDPEVQVNATILTENPDQSLEEPKTNLASDYREGKPGHNLVFQIATIYHYYLLVHLQFLRFELKTKMHDPRNLCTEH